MNKLERMKYRAKILKRAVVIALTFLVIALGVSLSFQSVR